jgi:nucleotide-binding universal stress UspA family protein
MLVPSTAPRRARKLIITLPLNRIRILPLAGIGERSREEVSMFKKVLVPLDRSELAEQALAQAATIARGSGATVDIVLVHEPIPFEGSGDAPWNAKLLEAERIYVRTIVAELAAGTNLPVTGAVLEGARVDMICKRVWDVNADLIVLTSHGRTGLSRAWLGSTADGVIRHSTTPVLMLRPVEGKQKRLRAGGVFTRILVPLDGSALAAAALTAATALAVCAGGSITLVRVVPPVPLIPSDLAFPITDPFPLTDEIATKTLVSQAQIDLVEVSQQLLHRGVTSVSSEVVVADNAPQAIIEYAKAHGVDVIAMSTHGRGASRLLVGSVADKVIRAAVIPVLIHRPIGVREQDGITEASAIAQLPALAEP